METYKLFNEINYFLAWLFQKLVNANLSPLDLDYARRKKVLFISCLNGAYMRGDILEHDYSAYHEKLNDIFLIFNDC